MNTKMNGPKTMQLRFPRYGDAQARDIIEKRIFAMLARPSEWRIELGNEFIRLKDTMKHGEWQRYFLKTFTEPYDITPRTARRYMVEAEAAKTANLTVLERQPATDPQAVRIREASRKAEKEEGSRRKKEKDELDRLFRRLTGELLKRSDWPKTQRAIRSTLNQLRLKLGVVAEGQHEDSAAA